MNTHALAAEIVTKIRNSMQDSSLNQALAVESLIRQAISDANDKARAEYYERLASQMYHDLH